MTFCTSGTWGHVHAICESTVQATVPPVWLFVLVTPVIVPLSDMDPDIVIGLAVVW
jgi:hypothetical protein